MGYGSTADALAAKRESRHIEFKESFDPTSAHDWCETIKDIVAISNSGGGFLLIGVNNVGVPVGTDCVPFLEIDPAHVTDKIHQYTAAQYCDFEITREKKDRHLIGCMKIGPSISELVNAPETGAFRN